MERNDQVPSQKYGQWFYDPYQQAHLRFHDGDNWTGNVITRKPQEGILSQFFSYPDPIEEALDSYRVRQHIRLSSAADATHKHHLKNAAFLLPAVGFFFLFARTAMSFGASESYPPVITVIVAVFTAISFFLFLRRWRKHTDIKDIPTVEVTGAHIGICELQGKVEPYHTPVASWATANLCVWTETLVERYEGGKNKSWRKKWSQADGSTKFYLRDSNGDKILIDVTGADPKDWCPVLDFHKHKPSTRLTERGLLVGEEIFVMGNVQMQENGELVVSSNNYYMNTLERKQPVNVGVGGEEKALRAARNAAVAAGAQFYILLAGLIVLLMYTFTQSRDAAIYLGGALAIVISIATAASMWTWRTWNRLRSIKWRISAAWSLIDIAAQRRHDLILALNETLEAAFTHENFTQEKVAELRMPTADEVSETAKTLVNDTKTFDRIVALKESYANLKTVENTTALMEQIIQTENQLAATRKFYNDAVTVAQTVSLEFPTSVLAGGAIGKIPPLLQNS